MLLREWGLTVRVMNMTYFKISSAVKYCASWQHTKVKETLIKNYKLTLAQSAIPCKSKNI